MAKINSTQYQSGKGNSGLNQGVTLHWNGSVPVATAYDDIYYSTASGYAESCHVFIGGVTWPRPLSDNMLRHHVEVIGELGFGSGLNFLATWHAWNMALASERPERWHYISVEGHPLSPEQMAQVSDGFAEWPEVYALREQMLAVYPAIDELNQGGIISRTITPTITLTWIFAPIESAMPMLEQRLHHHGEKISRWYLDGFSPAKNPAMWAPEVLAQVGNLTKPNGRVATFTVARAVRDGLEAAGFTLERRPGFGKKRHCLSGVLS